MYIPYGKQYIDDEDIKAVCDVLKSDFITQGPKINEFEQVFCEYVGSKYAVAFNSGTAALHASLFSIGIKEGDEVITTPNTFCATSNAILYNKAVPVFCDISLKTYNIDEDKIESLITDKTKAILPVHFAGLPCDMDKIKILSKKYNLKIIEDACHALGAKYKNKMIGSIGDITCFSFHPVKHITTGEGGMASTNSYEIYQKLLQLRSHGITRDKEMLYNNEGDWFYEMHFLGFNYRMTDFQAALGISQLKKNQNFVKKRKEIADIYFKELNSIKNIELSLIKPEYEVEHAFHLFIILIKNKKRKEVFDFLRKNSIGVNVHYIPVYKHPFYKEKGYDRYEKKCVNMNIYYQNCLSIPIYPHINKTDVQKVINLLQQVLKKR